MTRARTRTPSHQTPITVDLSSLLANPYGAGTCASRTPSRSERKYPRSSLHAQSASAIPNRLISTHPPQHKIVKTALKTRRSWVNPLEVKLFRRPSMPRLLPFFPLTFPSTLAPILRRDGWSRGPGGHWWTGLRPRRPPARSKPAAGFADSPRARPSHLSTPRTIPSNGQ